jgi:DNA-directed RNA polymerase subunit RPC12/RpoP
MKSFTRLLVTAGLVLGATALAFASPRSKALATLRTQEDFAQLKSGDAVLFVCSECTTVTEQPIESADQAMMLCKEGSKVTCPMCKKDHKIVMKGRPAAKTPRHEVVYVNDKGEECFFIAAAVQTP